MPAVFDLEAFLPYRLNQAADAVSVGFGAIYRDRHGMTRPEWRTLALLGAIGRMTATDISRRSAMHKTKVSRAVQSLEDRGWLRRRADDEDRRLEHLELTKAGWAIHGELSEIAIAYEADLRARLGADAVAALLSGLDAIEAARAAE